MYPIDNAPGIQDQQQGSEEVNSYQGLTLNRSLTAKLIASADEVKGNFVDVANHILSFEGVNERMSWRNLTFNKGRVTLAKLALRGKTLWLYLALDPEEFINTKYHGENQGSSKRYEKTPYAVKIKSQRGLNYAKCLVNILMERSEILFKNQASVYSVESFPCDTEENLISRGLIRISNANEEACD